MALMMSRKKGGALPSTMDIIVSNSSNGATWSYLTLPAEVISEYSKIKYTDITNSAGSAITECKYGNFDPSTAITNFRTLDNALTTAFNTTDTTITGITTDIVIGVYCSNGAVAKVTLSK